MRTEVGVRGFQWQEGYAALSVGDVTPVVAYIENQEAHYREWSSADELRALLEEAGVEIDLRYFE